MRIKVSEATNPQLNWLVAKARGIKVKQGPNGILYTIDQHTLTVYSPTTNWSQGGPLIDLWKVDVVHQGQHPEPWHAAVRCETGNGPTPLIAVIRAHVTSDMGEEVEVPEGLT